MNVRDQRRGGVQKGGGNAAHGAVAQDQALPRVERQQGLPEAGMSRQNYYAAAAADGELRRDRKEIFREIRIAGGPHPSKGCTSSKGNSKINWQIKTRT